MRNFLLLPLLSLAAACSTPQGNGFRHYDTPPKAPGTEVVPVEWSQRKPLPLYRVELADTAALAASVQPMAKAPGMGTEAATDDTLRLRMVQDDSHVWLVAESLAKTGGADSATLRREAEQRSGCLISDMAPVGAALVYRLDCR